MLEHTPIIISHLSALLIPIIALIGCYIAYQQMKTEKNKLKFDLFDKRYATYDSTMSFISDIAASGKVTEDKLVQFYIEIKESKWILDEDISEFLHENIYNKAHDIFFSQKKLSRTRPPKERDEILLDIDKMISDLRNEIDPLEKKFKPFLAFTM